MQVNKSGMKNPSNSTDMYAFVSQSEQKKKIKMEGSSGRRFLRHDATSQPQ